MGPELQSQGPKSSDSLLDNQHLPSHSTSPPKVPAVWYPLHKVNPSGDQLDRIPTQGPVVAG
jgi:hypothetical protein